jgi:carbamoylphosphate synthase large subunit
MKNEKSSITLPKEELKLVISLKKKLKAKSNVEVIRQALKALYETLDKNELLKAYHKASVSTQKFYQEEMAVFDSLVDEGIK